MQSSGNILVAVGANLPSGDNSPLQTVRGVRFPLEELGWRYLAGSRCYQNPAWPPGSGAPDYVNAVIMLEGSGSPSELLDDLHAIEAGAGRVRAQRYLARTLDLDLIAWGDTLLPDRDSVTRWIEATGPQRDVAPDRLFLPHPRMHERAFVLVPLVEIAPDWRHPILGRTALELRDALPAADLAALTPV